MSDSDDSDVPLALLAARKKKAATAAPPADDDSEPEEESSEEEEFDDGDDDDDDDFEEGMEEDDEEEEEEEDEEVDAKYYSSDSSDDVPLSSLKSPKKKKAKAAAKSPTKKAPAKKTTKAKTKTDTKARKKAAKKSSSSGKKSPVPSGKSSAGGNRPNLPCFALCDNDLDKGRLIQRFLCRWWYAVEWPDPSSLPDSPPKGYDALNGFAGVYICTRGASIGRIVDKRDKSTAPSFANYARKSSEELQGLLLKALAKQKEQLVEAEGPGTDAEKELGKMEKWTRKLNCKKLDKEAATALKAAGIRLE